MPVIVRSMMHAAEYSSRKAPAATTAPMASRISSLVEYIEGSDGL